MRKLVKKVKFDSKFVKERLTTLVLKENLKVYEELKDKEDDVKDKGLSQIRKRLDLNMDNSLKSVDLTYKQYSKALELLESLKERQLRRREKLLKWFKNYVVRIEKQEHARLVNKYNLSLNIPGLDDVIYNDDILIDTLFTDDEALPEEKVEAKENVAPKANLELEVNDAEFGEVVLDGCLPCSANSEAIENEKEKQKVIEKEETSQAKAEMFLQAVSS